jgi:hypothetical protein
VTTQIQIRRDTAANWESVDPVLADGEIGYDTTSSQFKVGNGVDGWSSLIFSSGGASSWNELQGKPTEFPPAEHGHEEITKSEDGKPTAYIRYADDTWKASPSLEVEGDLSVGGGVEIDGDLSLGGKFDGDLTVSGNINVEGGTINAPDGSSYLTEAPEDGKQYARQDAAWAEIQASGGGNGNPVVISDDPPASPEEGDLWYSSKAGDEGLYCWDGEVWFEAGGANGADGQDAKQIWSEVTADGDIYYSKGKVTVTGDLLASKADAGSNAVAVGNLAGKKGQGADSVAVGNGSGETDQGNNSVAIGSIAGQTTQAPNAIAIGTAAGRAGQLTGAIAIGFNSGMTDQGLYSLSIGSGSGQTAQSDHSIAVGRQSGSSGQGQNSIAVGRNAGQTDQGSTSIAIGFKAGQTSQGDNGIIISSSDVAVNGTIAGQIIVQSTTHELRSLPKSGFAMNGDPIIGTRRLISTLSTLRNATKDENTLEGMRDALADAIGGLIENLEHEIAGTMEISE